MKKVLSLIVTLCLVLSLSCALAEDVIYRDYERTDTTATDPATGRVVDLTDVYVTGVNKSMGSFWMDGANVEGTAWDERTENGHWGYFPAATFDAAAQMSALSDALATDPDVLIITPTAGEAVNEALTSAKEKGTVVIGWEATEDLSNFDYFLEPFIGKDYVEMHVDKVAELMGDDITYCLWVGKLTTPYQVLWCEYFYDYASEKYPNMTCVLDRGAWLEHNDNEETAYESAKQVLMTYEDVDLLWTPSSGGCLGLARAIEDLGMTGNVYAAGQSRPSASKVALDAGTYLFSTIHYPGAVWGAAAEVGRRIWAGEEIKTGTDLGMEGYNNVTVIGRWIYGEGYYWMDKDTIDDVVAKFPNF